MKKGIDLSCWQENIEYKKLKEQNIEFAIIRDGYGKNKIQKDKLFETHYKGLKDNNINVGCYHYSYMTSPEGAIHEAKMCLDFIKNKNFELPIFLDVEENRIIAQGKENITKGIINFCDIIKDAGYEAGVYANLNWFTNYIDIQKIIEKGYKIWLAQWNDKITSDFKVDYWQYSSKGQIDGISGNVDLDYEVKEEIKPSPEPLKTIEELAKEVIEGKWGNGENRYERLTKAGYNYNQIQDKVNELLGVTKKIYYIVKQGDTLSKISSKFGTTVKKLVELNSIKNQNLIYVNQKIRIK